MATLSNSPSTQSPRRPSQEGFTEGRGLKRKACDEEGRAEGAGEEEADIERHESNSPQNSAPTGTVRAVEKEGDQQQGGDEQQATSSTDASDQLSTGHNTKEGLPPQKVPSPGTGGDVVSAVSAPKPEALKKVPFSKRERPAKPKGPPQPCPRCESVNTKFCYFNNHVETQPRYFCKACQRYWTEGGALRDVPVGAGRRKPKQATSESTSKGSTLSGLSTQTAADALQSLRSESDASAQPRASFPTPAGTSACQGLGPGYNPALSQRLVPSGMPSGAVEASLVAVYPNLGDPASRGLSAAAAAHQHSMQSMAYVSSMHELALQQQQQRARHAASMSLSRGGSSMSSGGGSVGAASQGLAAGGGSLGPSPLPETGAGLGLGQAGNPMAGSLSLLGMPPPLGMPNPSLALQAPVASPLGNALPGPLRGSLSDLQSLQQAAPPPSLLQGAAVTSLQQVAALPRLQGALLPSSVQPPALAAVLPCLQASFPSLPALPGDPRIDMGNHAPLTQQDWLNFAAAAGQQAWHAQQAYHATALQSAALWGFNGGGFGGGYFAPNPLPYQGAPGYAPNDWGSPLGAAQQPPLAYPASPSRHSSHPTQHDFGAT